jgi:hypothetical protein
MTDSNLPPDADEAASFDDALTDLPGDASGEDALTDDDARTGDTAPTSNGADFEGVDITESDGPSQEAGDDLVPGAGGA